MSALVAFRNAKCKGVMSKALLLLGTLVSLGAFALAQTLPTTTLHTPQKGGYLNAASNSVTERRTFQLGGKEYRTRLSLEETALGPEWESPSPLPLSLAKVEEIARSELRKLVTDEPRWMVTDFHLGRFERRSNWYYAVTLKPDVEVAGVRADSFIALVDFSGKPARIWCAETGKAP